MIHGPPGGVAAAARGQGSESSLSHWATARGPASGGQVKNRSKMVTVTDTIQR